VKSIRLSLIVYFLGLLALAQGGVSLFVYQTSEATLRSKERSTRALLQARYENQCQTVHEEFDSRLLRRAQTLAQLAQSQSGGSRTQEVVAMKVLTAGLNPKAAVTAPLWLQDKMQGWTAFSLNRIPFIKIQYAEDVVVGESEGHDTEYFQVYTSKGETLQHSRSMGKHSFTLDRAVREKTGLFEWQPDETELAPGVHVRRVTLKTPVTRFRVHQPRPPLTTNRGSMGKRASQSRPPSEPPSAPRTPPPPSRGPTIPFQEYDRSSPAIFIQFASETKSRDVALKTLGDELYDDLSNLETESQSTLTALRHRLLGINLGAFGAAVLGGCLLVGLGLIPLRRLSEAVS